MFIASEFPDSYTIKIRQNQSIEKQFNPNKHKPESISY